MAQDPRELQQLIEQAKPDVSAWQLARVYAEALLNAAEAQSAAADVIAELNALLDDVTQRDPYLAAFFSSGVIGKEAREKALQGAFEGRAHPLLVNFLLVLNEHDRLMLIRPIRDQLRELDDLRHRRFRCQVRSAVPLPDDQRERLLGDLRKSFRLEPILDEQTDPAVLGGMILRVGDWVFDGSVRTRIHNLREQLREMSSHEIQSGRDRFGTE
jgi:F-type H+-transporting ATPase subunit delta